MEQHSFLTGNLLLLAPLFESHQLTNRHSVNCHKFNRNRHYNMEPGLTASDNTSDLTRSPISAFVSCPNWTSAPKNLRIFSSLLESLLELLLLVVVFVVRESGVAGGGGVIEPELPFLTGELLQPFRLVRCCCGDLGVTTRAPSGESGVLHCSLFPGIERGKKKHANIITSSLLCCHSQHTHVFYFVCC